MASVNRAILIGHLGKDPEARYMPNGEAVSSFSIATSETWTDKNSGEKREATEWHNIVAYRKLAEICNQYLAKGAQVYIEGKIKTEKWQDKQGQDRYTTKIHAETMKMLGGKRDGEQSAPRNEGAPAQSQQRSAPAQSGGGGSFDDFEDDIPF